MQVRDATRIDRAGQRRDCDDRADGAVGGGAVRAADCEVSAASIGVLAVSNASVSLSGGGIHDNTAAGVQVGDGSPQLTVTLRPLLADCLEKDPKKRLSAIADVRFDLEEQAPVRTAAAAAAREPMRARPRDHGSRSCAR